MNPASVERKEIIGLHRITKKVLRDLCKKNQLYQTPELNEVLYLHYQGFQYIECLEEYTELKCLWLECNAISEIQGLENQSKLKCLFLQNNLIKCIENLENCRELDMLNLASNHIRKIENCGIDILPVLNTLNLSSNCLRDSESLRGLEECKTLTVLDLANNRIDDILVVKIFAKMPELRVLVLQGNPVVSKIPQYRKTLVLECKELTYLDSRPVFPKDRACAEAWKRGGYNEERKEQERWNRRDRKKIRDSVNATIRMRNKHKPPNEQMELITSSDSETDEKRRKEAKERRATKKDPRLLIETGEDIEDEGNLSDIWDEVSGPNAVIPKVQYEDQSDVEENNIVENLKAKTVDAPIEVPNVQKVEELQRNDVSNIFNIVDKPEIDEDGDNVPALISDIGDAEINVAQNINRKRALIEEIHDDSEHIVGKKIFIEEFNSAEDVVQEKQQGEIVKEPINNTGAIKKRFPIEETNEKDTDSNMPSTDLNEAMSFESVDINYETFKNPLVKKEKEAEFFKDSADQDLLELSNTVKKPFWVEEIFSQTTNMEKSQNISSFDLITSVENVGDSFEAERKLQSNIEFDFNITAEKAKEPVLKINDREQVAASKNKIEELFGFDKTLALKKSELTDVGFVQERKIVDEVIGQQENARKTTLIEEFSETPARSTENLLLEEAKDIFEKSFIAGKPTNVGIVKDLNSQTTEICQDNKMEFLEVTENPLSFLKTFGKNTDLKPEKLNTKLMLIEEIEESTLDTSEDNFVTVNSVTDSNIGNKNVFENLELGEMITEDSQKSSSLMETIEVETETTISADLHEAESEKVLIIPENKLLSVSEAATSRQSLEAPSIAEVADLSYENKLEPAADNLKPISDSESDISNGSDDLCSVTSTDNEDSSSEKPSTSKSISIIDPYMKITEMSDYSYKPPSSSESESEDETEKLQYNAAADAICNVVMSRVGEHEQPKADKKIFLPPLEGIEVLPENYEPVLEMEKMLKLLPDDEAEQRAKRLETSNDSTEEASLKTADEIKYEAECAEINRQVVEDFETLNANMEYFIEQFQQEQQQMTGEVNCNIEECMTTLNIQEENELDPDHTTVFEKTIQTKQISLEERKADDDIQFDVVYKETITTETELTTELSTDLTLETVNQVTEKELTVTEHRENHDMEMLTCEQYQSKDVSQHEMIYQTEHHENEAQETLALADNVELLNACGDHIGIGQTSEKLPFMELDEVLQRPLLKTYERESIELQALLKKLELQNEKLTFVKKTCDALLMKTEEKELCSDEEEKSDDSYHDAVDSLKNETVMVDEVITELVDDVVERGEENELNNKKPKNYVITDSDLESDEEYSYTGPPKPEEPPVKSIRSVLGAFNNLIKEIAYKNRVDREREMKAFKSQRVPTSQAAKLSSLQTLLETPSLLEHHKHSYEQLKPKVDSIKQQNTKELKQLVERVYAQKDKYNDSLEVVDGRLVVIKKETGEVKELSEQQQQHTESESDAESDEYETANSSNENEKEKKSKNLIWDFSMGATKPHTWIPKYQPTMRKSAEQLILNAIEANENDLKLNEQENDEDSEEDCADGNKTLRKIDSRPSVFSNIDEEFFKNLDFKKIAEESTQDENFVEVARSYEELRQIIKQSGMETARSMVSIEEQAIIDTLKPVEGVEVAENQIEKDELTQAEDDLMHKLVQRTKEAKERGEDNLISEADPNDKPYLIKDTEISKQEDDTDSVKTLLEEELELPATVEPLRNYKVVKMLKKLQTDNPIAQDILQELKAPDLGDFTSPLEMKVEAENLKDAQTDYEQKFAEYQKHKLEKLSIVECNEIAIQCEPSGFEIPKQIPYVISESTEVSVISTSTTDIQCDVDNVNQTVTQAVIADSSVDIITEEAFEVTEI